MIKADERRNNKIKGFMDNKNVGNSCRLKGEKYKKTFTRNRKISCQDLLLMTLNKQGKNTSFEIRDYCIKKKGEKKIMYSEEAYLKQRRHLNPEVFKEINKIYLEDFYEDKPYIKRKNGYIELAVDGSTEEIPNTPQNREFFGYAKNQGGNNSARAKLSSIYDVNNHFYIDVEVDEYKASEIELAKKNIEKMIEIIGEEKILIVFDRGYPSIEFFYWLEQKNIKFLMRLKDRNYKEEKKKMKQEDEIIELRYTNSRMHIIKEKEPEIYEKMKEKSGAEYRFTKIKINEKTIEYLISNLSMEEFSTSDLKEVYGDRWEIEVSYNSIKNKLKIESFTGNLPIYIYQDIYAQTVVYNQIQDMLCVANRELEKKNKEKNMKLEYKINENKAMGLYKEKFIKILLIKEENKRISEYTELIEEMKMYTSAIRKNRETQPRKWNYRNKYRTNLKPSF